MKRERPRHAGGVFALREEEGPQKRARGQLLHAKKIDDEQYREYCQTEQYFEHFATSLTVNDSVPGFVVAESRGDGVFCKPVFGRQAVESFVYASDLAAVRAHGRGSAHAEIVLRLVVVQAFGVLVGLYKQLHAAIVPADELCRVEWHFVV